MVATFIFGAAFLSIEVREFAAMIARGAGPTRSAFLSAFFTLVGCHGFHVSAGLLWLLTMMAQVFAKGYGWTFSGAFSALACSGIPWTSLGLGYSPWFI
jgi:cytochrome o ubiquinol oxidase subunit III